MKYFGVGLVFLLLAAHVYTQADGNPHQWDRKRRCDHTDYSPPCGPCEGIGGIPTGDDNNKITITSCQVLSNATGVDPSTLVKPVWGTRWTADDYHEILIGKKTDPFCFQAFPGNDSVGAMCYREQYGKQIYDMEKNFALREDLTLKTVVGKVQTTVIHQDLNFWVVNKFPWYAAGVHQCVCTEVHEGADLTKESMYPIQKNWTDQLFYIGREKIGVEWSSEKEMILDHWAFGPHHVWSTPKDGKIVRMYQPFNGLQVFKDGTNPGAVDESLFDDIPPALCKKGGAAFRIGCTDDGYPKKTAKKDENSLRGVLTDETETQMEWQRARTKIPREHYKGADFESMSRTLNKWIQEGAAMTKRCDEWSAPEIQQLQALLYIARESSLDDIYQLTNDNRRLRKDLHDLYEGWSELNRLVESHEDSSVLHNIQRDGHCHEAVMWYVHHLTEETKAALADSGIVIPLLSLGSHSERCSQGGPVENGWAQVCKRYEEQVTCASCHSNSRPSVKDSFVI